MSNQSEIQSMTSSTVNNAIREIARKYIRGIVCYHLNSHRPDVIEKIKANIKRNHQALKNLGLTEEQLKIYQQKAKKFVDTPTKEMTTEQFELIVDMIFF